MFFTIYCASGIVAGARLFESTFGMSYETALWAGAAATILYTFIGGFHGGKLDRYRAGQPDDFRADPDAGDRHLRRRRHRYFDAGDRAQNPANLDMLKGLNFVAILSLLGWGTGYFGQPHITARFMAADSHRTIRSARRISMTG